MEYLIRFTYLPVLYALLPLVIVFAWFRNRIRKQIVYRYSLASLLHAKKITSTHPYKKIISALRLVAMFCMVILIAKPKLIDPKSNVTVDGVDIMLALDISGSMRLSHHAGDGRPRIVVAKEEAQRFVENRTNDAIGLVVFANDVLSRCPLTADKTVLKEIIEETDLGFIDPGGTKLSLGLTMAINRLKQSKAKSKIVILLTDGAPAKDPISPNIPLELAKKFGVKIYTIGIGDGQEVWTTHPFYGPMLTATNVDKALLEKFARETGGKCFLARDAQDMRAIYNTIDLLEKTEIETPLFSRTYDWFMPLLVLLCMLLLIELFISSFVWFSIA